MTTLHSRADAADRGMAAWALHASARALAAMSWFSGALFAGYILAFYIGAIPEGRFALWNTSLPKLYEPGSPAAQVTIGIHFAAGAVLLLLGPIQLIGRVRRRLPTLHRWLGRTYVVCAGFAGLGGLSYIVGKGTIGGPVMNLGFGLYGALMVLAAVQAWRNALARRWDAHRAWALRLFALSVGSWLYRMEYGFWLPATHHLGHASDFSGLFDRVMVFFFYIPNLLVAEAFIRARRVPTRPAPALSAALILTAATLLIGVATFYFARFYWGPNVAMVLGREG